VANSLLDTALDLSVVGGYTNVGYRIRRRGWGPLPRMDDKVVLITGASSSIGQAAADGFAGPGASVWLAVRNRARRARPGEDPRVPEPGERPRRIVRPQPLGVGAPRSFMSRTCTAHMHLTTS
jgi:hypothetical protein